MHFVGYTATGAIAFVALAPADCRAAWVAPPGGGLLDITPEQAAAVRARPAAWRVEDDALVPA